MAANNVKQAAEIAADYIWHLFYDELASPEDGVDKAGEIYSLICGEELDYDAVLGDSAENMKTYG
jgi:hypothetical protein